MGYVTVVCRGLNGWEDGTESCVGDSIGHPITFCTSLWELVDGGHMEYSIVLRYTMEHPLMSHMSLGD